MPPKLTKKKRDEYQKKLPIPMLKPATRGVLVSQLPLAEAEERTKKNGWLVW